MLIVPLLNTPGVNMRRLKVGGQVSAGTTFIDLDDVLVPTSNLIGTEGAAMKYVMQNFNHERLSISVGVNRLARVALSSAFEYCLKREAFSKPLMEQPVVRHRLAKAGGLLEMHWAWVESFCYQMTKLSEAEANTKVRQTPSKYLRNVDQADSVHFRAGRSHSSRESRSWHGS